MKIRLPARFYNDVKQKLTATDINLMIKAIQLIDGWSFRRMNTFDSAGGDTGTPYYVTGGGYHTNPPFRIWKGGALYKTGATTLVVKGAATPAGAETLKFYVNGVLAHTIAATIPSTWTANITLSGLTAEQPVWLEIKVEGSSAIVTRFARYYVYEAYMEPVTASGWVAPTAFSATWEASKLEAIKTAITWLYARLNMVPFVPATRLMVQPGAYRDPAIKPEMSNWPLYYGSVLKAFNEGEVLRTYVRWTNYTSPQERFKIYYDGALAYTSPTNGPGTYSYYIPIALTHALGTRKEVWIHSECLVAGPGVPPNDIKPSRYDLVLCRTEADATGYNYWTPPAEWIYGSKTAASVTSTLNSMVTALTTIKSRIDTNTWVWGRWYLQRKFYSWDDNTGPKLHKRSLPELIRNGDRLVLYGKGLNLGFANIIPPEDAAKLLEEYTFGRSESVIATDKAERRSIYLDNYSDLFHGTVYYGVSPNDMLLEEYFY